MDARPPPDPVDRHVPAARRRDRRRDPAGAARARPVALGFALVTWVVSLLLLVGYLPGPAPASSSSRRVDWIPFFGIQYKLGADGLSVALVVLTTTLIVDLASWRASSRSRPGSRNT